MWVKVCGITRAEDGLAAARAGADAIGLNFVSGPRLITPDRASDILQMLPHHVVPVALVRLEEERLDANLCKWLLGSRIRHLQVYAARSTSAIERLTSEGFSVFAVVRVRGTALGDELDSALARAGSAVVLDAYDPGRLGGTGTPFAWPLLSAARKEGRLDGWPPIILAGGLTPDNVREAIRQGEPDGVDVSSGVERDNEPGVKDISMVEAFVAHARAASQ